MLGTAALACAPVLRGTLFSSVLVQAPVVNRVGPLAPKPDS